MRYNCQAEANGIKPRSDIVTASVPERREGAARMKVHRILALSTMLMVPGLTASAQSPSAAPSDSNGVTATREMIGSFAKAFTTPATLTGKIPRWVTAICPVAKGQKLAFTRFITQRVQAIAAAAGAPVSTDPSCTPNIEIIFTTTPQDLLDHIRKEEPDYLGYARTSEQRVKLATVTRPVQAWYTTETIDLKGVHRMDTGRRLDTGIEMSNFSALGGSSRDPIYLPDATYARVTGNHIDDGASSGFNHVIIAVDSTKLAGTQVIPLSDYIAMLALTQVNSLDTCQRLPSVVNLMAAGCDQKIEGMTAADLAYLRGLYKMDAAKSLVYQQNEIGDLMQNSLRH
jgi:hypothetical protein